MIDVNSPSNRELWLETNSVPSRSLEDDMVESLDRMYQRTVATVQVRFYEKMKNITEKKNAFQSQVVYAHPWADFQEWNPREEDVVDTWVMIQRSKMEQMLESLETLFLYKKNQIQKRSEW
jgi:hypothetical protein